MLAHSNKIIIFPVCGPVAQEEDDLIHLPTGDQASLMLFPAFSLSFAALWFISSHLSLPPLLFSLFPFLPNLFIIIEFPNYDL